MMYIHGNNETDKTINVSKIANKVHETTTFLLVNLPNFNRFYLFTLSQQYTFLNLVSNNHATL